MRKSPIFIPALALGVAGAILAATTGLANPITYTMQATATGSLGATTFMNATVTLRMNNDTNSIFFDSVLGLFEINGTASVSVAGVNGGLPMTFSDTIQVYSGQTPSGPLVGFFDASVNPPFGLDILDNMNPVFASYDLTSIGPTTGTAVLGGGAPPNFLGFPTSGGDFLLTGVGTGVGPAIATFSATVAAVPEPPIGRGLSVALAIGGMLFGARRIARRQRESPIS